MNIILIKTLCVMGFAYFLGSLPLSLILTRFHNMPDPRHYGSRNIGATNVGRKKKSLGIAVFLMDGCKVFLAITIARHLHLHDSFLPLVWSSTILGQTRSMFLKLKGGKGMSCFIAGIAILYPTWFIPLCIPGLTVLLLSSRVWVASVFVVSLFLIFSITISTHYLFVHAAITVWIIFMHASNFQHYKKQRRENAADAMSLKT